MIRKDVVIAVLATFCLTSTLFMITTSKSQSGVGEYNPWADYNGDGTIDIFDIVPVAVSFGATGDSTKNVTIAGHANKLAYSQAFTILDPWQTLITPWISVDEYSKLTVCICNGAWGEGIHNSYKLRTMHVGGNELYCMVVDNRTDFGEYLVQTYDVPNQLIQIVFVNNDSGPNYIALDVYLIP